jgi:hypothetical protein
MPEEKAPELGAFLAASLMYFCSGKPMHFCSGVDIKTFLISDVYVGSGGVLPLMSPRRFPLEVAYTFRAA